MFGYGATVKFEKNTVKLFHGESFQPEPAQMEYLVSNRPGKNQQIDPYGAVCKGDDTTLIPRPGHEPVTADTYPKRRRQPVSRLNQARAWSTGDIALQRFPFASTMRFGGVELFK